MPEKKINIPFLGITRNTDDGQCQDGECMELINARIKNGSIEPISHPIILKTLEEEYTKGFYHSVAQKYIFIKSKNGTMVSYDQTFKNSEQLPETVTGVTDIQFIGKILIANTPSGLYYLMHEDSYKLIGQKPELELRAYATDEKVLESSIDTFNFSFSQGNTPKKIDYRDIPQFLDLLDVQKNKTLSPHMGNGRFVGPVMIRAALRTYSGDYICHTPIKLICPSTRVYSNDWYMQETLCIKYSFNNNQRGIDFFQKFNTYRIKIEYDFTNLGAWKEIITSVDVFITKEISLMDRELLLKDGINIEQAGSAADNQFLNLPAYPKTDISSKLLSLKNIFFLSDTCEFTSGSAYIYPAKESEITLTDDSFTHNNLFAESAIVYNGRLHLGNIYNKLFSGYLIDHRISSQGKINGNPVGTNIMAFYKSYIYIHTDNGTKIVMEEGKGIIGALSPFIMYPDRRAYQMIVYVKYFNFSTNEIQHNKTVLELKKSESYNLAYYLNIDNYLGFKPVDFVESGVLISSSEYESTGIVIENIEYSPNKIKVSSLNNPFTFPPSTTYTPSNGKILAFSANTTALSQGQFGQHPLIVFCSDGIYAMSVGTDIIYATSSPISRDVCTNPDSVTPIDNAIAFATEKGILLLQGTQIQNISVAINGYLPSCIESSLVLSKIANIPKLLNSISSARFNDYITGCEISYNYQEQELIISNKEYQYTYIYSLASGQWYKSSYIIKTFINSYPEILAIDQYNNICNIQNNHRTVANVLLITRPIKLGTLTHKRILQSALRGMVRRSISDLYFKGEPVTLRGDLMTLFKDVGFYILGSDDAEHFMLISGTEAIEDLRDIVSKMNKSKAYKYFMFAFVGGVRTDVSINYVELIADEAFNNRLR